MRVLRAILFCLAASSAAAATYYVDQSAGNDANAGTSGSPWKNCPGMYNAGVAMHTGSGVLAAGDVVYMDSGDTWQLSAGAVAVGCGFLMKAGVEYYGNSWPSIVSGKPADSGAILKCMGYCPSGLVRVNQDHATFSNVLDHFELDINSQTANGVDINHGYGTNGIIQAPKVFRNIWAHDQIGSGSTNGYVYLFTVSDQTSDQSGWVGNVQFLNCVGSRASRDCFVTYPGNGGAVSNILYRNCVAHGIKNDASYTEGHGFVAKGRVRGQVIFENCMATNVNSSPFFVNGPEDGLGPGPTNFLIRSCIGQTADNNGTYRIYGTWTGTVAGNIYNCLSYPNETSGGFVMGGVTSTFDISVYNCTFLGFVDIQNPTGTGTLTFRNNIIIESDDPCLYDAGTDIDTHSNNIYYRSSGGTLVQSGGTDYTSGSLTTYEASGLSSDPLLKNTSNLPNSFSGSIPDRDGLSLLPTSPAINAGTDLSAVFTTSIGGVTRPVGAAFDIGAYENDPMIVNYAMPLRLLKLRGR